MTNWFAPLGISQSEAARQLGISQSYICDIVHGRRVMNVMLAVKIERVYGPRLGINAKDLLLPLLEKQIHAQRLREAQAKR